MFWKIAAPLLAIATLVAMTEPPPPTPNATIEGVVRMKQEPQRRAANRYPGAGSGAARPVQDIPAVVYLKGRIADTAPSGPVDLAQQDTAFAPPIVVVPLGTTVEFPNRDPFFHNVFSYSGAGRFDLGRYPRGESKSVTFEEAGVIKVYCEVHESMRAAIVVVENPYYAIPDAEGSFRIEGVPPGTYTIVAWHADRREQEQQVTVPATGSVRVELEL